MTAPSTIDDLIAVLPEGAIEVIEAVMARLPAVKLYEILAHTGSARDARGVPYADLLVTLVAAGLVNVNNGSGPDDPEAFYRLADFSATRTSLKRRRQQELLPHHPGPRLRLSPLAERMSA